MAARGGLGKPVRVVPPPAGRSPGRRPSLQQNGCPAAVMPARGICLASRWPSFAAHGSFPVAWIVEEEKGEGIPWECGGDASRPPLHTPGLRSSVCVLAPGSLNDPSEQLWFALPFHTSHSYSSWGKEITCNSIRRCFYVRVHQKVVFLSIYAKTDLKIDA